MSEKKGGKKGNKEKDSPEFQQAAMMKTLSEIISISVDKVSRGEALNLVRTRPAFVALSLPCLFLSRHD